MGTQKAGGWFYQQGQGFWRRGAQLVQIIKAELQCPAASWMFDLCQPPAGSIYLQGASHHQPFLRPRRSSWKDDTKEEHLGSGQEYVEFSFPIPPLPASLPVTHTRQLDKADSSGMLEQAQAGSRIWDGSDGKSRLCRMPHWEGGWRWHVQRRERCGIK